MKKNSQNILRLTLVFVLILSGCALGSNPKGLAKQTIDWLLELGPGLGNPLKYPGLMAKAASLGVKVGKLNARDKAIYDEELGRLAGTRAADILDLFGKALDDSLGVEGMSALLSTEGLGAMLGIEGMNDVLAGIGAALSSNAQPTGASVESDRVVGGFLVGISSGPTPIESLSSDVPEETKERGGIMGFLGGLFGGGSKSADSSSSSGGKPTPLADDATHKQLMAKYDEIATYLVNNPEYTNALEVEYAKTMTNGYRWMLQLAGLGWFNKELRDGMIEEINEAIAGLEDW